MDDLEDITRQLLAAESGGQEALDRAFASVYPQLRQLARSRRRDWRGEPTLSTTALIHEAYLKAPAGAAGRFRNRGHFFASASKAMRHVLINRARDRRAVKRGGGRRDITLDEGQSMADAVPAEELVALDRSLGRLESLNSRQARVVECLFFGGLTIEETAEALEVSPATVKRDWTAARAWLYREMQA